MDAVPMGRSQSMDDARLTWEANVHFDGVRALVGDGYEHCTYPLCVMHREAVEPLESRLEALEEQKSGAYSERNQVVVAMARVALMLGCNAGVREHEGEDWEDDWRTVVFIDLPTGQVSWHFHDSEKHLLGGLPRYMGHWDGHSTDEKYARLRELVHPQQEER